MGRTEAGGPWLAWCLSWSLVGKGREPRLRVRRRERSGAGAGNQWQPPALPCPCAPSPDALPSDLPLLPLTLYTLANYPGS